MANLADEIRTENCSDCDYMVTEDDPYFATPCGTFCTECMETKHARTCEICAGEFDLTNSELE